MTSVALGPADLTPGYRDPIGASGAIQPHGVLLALDPETLRIEQVAGDTRGLLDADPDALLGQPLTQWIGGAGVARVRDVLQVPQGPRRQPPSLPFVTLTGHHPIDAIAHQRGGVVILELEPASAEPRSDAVAMLQAMLTQLHGAETLRGFQQAMADVIQSVTGFDRVMVYQFQADGSGVVIAEALGRAGVDSYLGQHFPASDIPAPARALYLANWLRLIPDTAYTPAVPQPLVNPRTGQPLDLSQSVLRGVPPVHLQYLGNMGVRASMTISLVLSARLWGLIACHNTTPRRVPHRLRAACEIFAETASYQLKSRIAASELEAALDAAQSTASLIRRLSDEPSLPDGLAHYSEGLQSYLSAGGIAFCFNGVIDRHGITPTAGQIHEIIEWLDTQDVRVLATDHLASQLPRARAYAGVASGLLAASLSTEPVSYILWFRPEIERTVSRAGHPASPRESGASGSRLTPQGSLAEWEETVRFHAQPWTLADIEAAKSLRLGLLEVVLRRIDSLAQEREQARLSQNLLMAELDHRVKNMLSTVQALAAQSEASTETLEEFLGSFDGRLEAMSRSHSLLTKSRWEGGDLGALIREEMAPFTSKTKRPTLVMPPGAIMLRPKATVAFALAVHELVTNAAKYGALSVPGGQVRVEWRSEHRDGPVLVVTWRESGGPRVVEPQHSGFGRGLIESYLAYELGGTVRLRFHPEGVVCRVVVPWDQIVSSSEPPLPDTVAAPAEPTLEGMNVLLVEDNAMVATSVIHALRSMRAQVVGPAARLPAAMELAEKSQIDVAVLDVDLDGKMVWPAADILAGRGIRFLFATGYEAALVMPARFQNYTVLNKPFKRDGLMSALLQVISPEQVRPGRDTYP